MKSEIINGLEAIGREMGQSTYWRCTMDEWNIIAFGMIPYERAKYVEDFVENLVAERASKHYDMPVTKDQLLPEQLSKIRGAVLKGFTLGMFDSAKENNKMVV